VAANLGVAPQLFGNRISLLQIVSELQVVRAVGQAPDLLCNGDVEAHEPDRW
jgi:hypothetical protein